VLDKVLLMVASVAMVVLCQMILLKRVNAHQNTHFHITMVLKLDMKEVEEQVVLKMPNMVAAVVVLFGLVLLILFHCLEEMLLLRVRMVFAHLSILSDQVVALVVQSNLLLPILKVTDIYLLKEEMAQMVAVVVAQAAAWLSISCKVSWLLLTQPKVIIGLVHLIYQEETQELLKKMRAILQVMQDSKVQFGTLNA